MSQRVKKNSCNIKKDISQLGKAIICDIQRRVTTIFSNNIACGYWGTYWKDQATFLHHIFIIRLYK